MPTLSQIPLLAAMLGQRPVEEDQDVREPDSDADDVASNVANALREQQAESVRKSLLTALAPKRASSFEDLVGEDLQRGVDTANSGYVQPRKQAFGTPTAERISLNNAQPTRPLSLPKVGRPGEVDELEKYITVSPETQRQYHLEKHKRSSPEDAAAYLASRVENAPHEEVEALEKWKEQDSLAKKMQGKQFALDERQADNAASLKQESFKGRRYGSSVHGGATPEELAERQARTNDIMSEFRNRQTLANRNAGMGNSAAMYAGTSRYNAKLPGGAVAKADPDVEAKAEFDARKQAVADKYAPEDNSTVKVLPGGSQVRWDTGRPKFVGPASGGNEELAAEYLAKISGQAGLSKPVASLDEFRQQQALNRKQNTQLAEEKSQRNLASMMMGRSGGALPKDASLAQTRAFNTGRRQGPTYADMLQYQKDETGKKRDEATRKEALEEIGRLNQVLANERVDPKTKTVAQDRLNVLMKQVGGIQSSDETTTSGMKRKSADELMAQTKPAVAAKESKPLKSKSSVGQALEAGTSNLAEMVKEELNPESPYDMLPLLISPSGFLGSLFARLAGRQMESKEPVTPLPKTSRKAKDEEDSVDSSPLFSGFGGY